MWQGHGGRGPTWDGDVSGDVVLTQEGGKAVYGFGRIAFPRRWFRQRGLRHSQEGDAWQEYDGKTADLPGVSPRRLCWGKDPPTVDLRRARSNVWRQR